MAQEGARGANPHAGPIRQVLFEIAAPAVHEVVAHVGRTITGRAIGGCLASVFDGLQRHPDLTFAARRGQRFDRLSLLIPAQEVHVSVGVSGIALQDLLDQTDRLHVLLPIQRGAQAEARHGVGHRDLCDGLTLVLAANRVFGRGLLCCQVSVYGAAQVRQPDPVLADAMKQLDDERGVGAGRQYLDCCRSRRLSTRSCRRPGGPCARTAVHRRAAAGSR